MLSVSFLAKDAKQAHAFRSVLVSAFEQVLEPVKSAFYGDVEVIVEKETDEVH
jgi:hypothetical protein